MRIISGRFRGKRIIAPGNLPVRPTTDMAKEALFNLIDNHFDVDSLSFLDLCSGTGNISFEMASRGCANVTAVDLNRKCANFIAKTNDELNLGIEVVQSDALNFINNTPETFDIIFADPPYKFAAINEFSTKVLESGRLNKGGWLILEHASEKKKQINVKFKEQRVYGSSCFTIFEV